MKKLLLLLLHLPAYSYISAFPDTTLDSERVQCFVQGQTTSRGQATNCWPLNWWTTALPTEPRILTNLISWMSGQFQLFSQSGWTLKNLTISPSPVRSGTKLRSWTSLRLEADFGMTAGLRNLTSLPLQMQTKGTTARIGRIYKCKNDWNVLVHGYDK